MNDNDQQPTEQPTPSEALDTPEVQNDAIAPTSADKSPVDNAPTEEAPLDEPADKTPLEEASLIEAEPARINQNETTPAPAIPPTDTIRRLSKKQLIIIAVVAVLVVAGAIVALQYVTRTSLFKQAEQSVSREQSSTAPRATLGIAVTVADGTVEYLSDDDTWQAATTDTQLKEGYSVRTGADGRAVLTLDDGSAVRLDANTTAKLDSLAAHDIKITQQAGTIYSRVVPSERAYTVTVDDTTYRALGTAFVTVKTASENGVQVYQNSVKASGQETAVKEGQQYYKEAADANLKAKITQLDLDALTDNAFIAWNLAEDEKDTKFKEKLGVLADIKQKTADKAKQAEEARQTAEAEQQRKDKELAQKKADEEKKRKEKENQSKARVTRGSMSLTRNDTTLNWSYTGSAVHGYKLVYSQTNSTPTFGESSAIYFSDPATTSAGLPKEFKPSAGTYYARICAYTAGTEAEPCVDYSNTLTIVIN